jgi:MFS family permease
MMDTAGAIAGPASAFFLLRALHNRYAALFALTLIPGLAAAALIAFFVKEKSRAGVPHISFGERWRMLPAAYRKFLAAVALFGAGDFAHTLLILLATQKLAPAYGAARAASLGVALYVLHNVFYAAFALVAGWLADRFQKNHLLAGGYIVAALMAAAIAVLPFSLWSLTMIFIFGGIYVAIEETGEDSFCAELVDERQHGMAFGVLATVNGAGDFLSSIIVGALWAGVGTAAAFGYSAVLFATGALLVLRVPSPRG